MRKELRERMTKAFAALQDEMVKNPGISVEADELIKSLVKDFRPAARAAYTAAVETRKAERVAKRETKAAALTEARAAKSEAEAKLKAAMAIKVNERVARKRAAAAEVVEAAPVEADVPADQPADLEIF